MFVFFLPFVLFGQYTRHDMFVWLSRNGTYLAFSEEVPLRRLLPCE